MLGLKDEWQGCLEQLKNSQAWMILHSRDQPSSAIRPGCTSLGVHLDLLLLKCKEQIGKRSGQGTLPRGYDRASPPEKGEGRWSYAHGWAQKGEIPMLFDSAEGKRSCQGATCGPVTLYSQGGMTPYKNLWLSREKGDV